jgi:AcrR family transcriptional regulator
VTERVPLAARDTARDRIFDGAVRCVVRDGASASMAEIAAAAGVSKALLHYHYTDRAHLLADLVTRLAQRIVARERAAMGGPADSPGTPPAPVGNPVDALWSWAEGELRTGELRALLELATVRDVPVRQAWDEAATERRRTAARTVELVFDRLGLTPRMPVTLLGDANVAFLDGLALDRGSTRDSRVGFDLFWLALLSLGD